MGKGRTPSSELDWMIYNLEMKKYEKIKRTSEKTYKKVIENNKKKIESIQDKTNKTKKKKKQDIQDKTN